MKTSNFKNYSVVVLAVLVLIALFIFAPKSSNNSFFRAGGGTSLKDLNQTDTTTTTMLVNVQTNQTTEQNLFQGLVIGNYYTRQSGMFLDANFVGGWSTEYGVCTPVLSLGAGLDFGRFQLEYKIGNFKRTSIGAVGIDAQYSNRCIGLGEGAGVANAMQIGAKIGQTKIAVGHQGGEEFYTFNGGNWYACVETPICKYVSLAGGVNMAENVTGYVAAKASLNNNCLVVTGNKLGTDAQSCIVTYNRSNIAVGKNVKMNVAASVYTQATKTGAHLVAGLSKGNATLFAQAGTTFFENALTPVVGWGLNLVF